MQYNAIVRAGKPLGLTACLFFIGLNTHNLQAQQKALVNTVQSPYAKLYSADMGSVVWTTGFWAERMAVCKNAMVPHLVQTYMDAGLSHAYKNFEIAAGLDTGSHQGPPFHDGDFYKLVEGAASLYALTKDPALDRWMDQVIAVIAKVQRPDGYIHTPVIIEERKQTHAVKPFQDRLNFETYNMGHLMTAACVHYRVTGKTSMLQLAVKAADYLYAFYQQASPELARNAICPSHYMGIVEMYRTTRDKKYLELARNLVDIRGSVPEGTDDNQDRIPFRQQTTVMGHAVRANYLYAGVADVYAETGDDSLVRSLHLIWNNLVQRKMYITGGCGALYDGVSPDGVSYNPAEIQKVHQAYGKDYQLPNTTAHNETCANIGNLLWNWRMLQLTGEAKYTDVLERALYNSILSGISLDGNNFFYTNPLRAADDLPYRLRWAGGRTTYISLSNCCPPNLVRTLAEVSNYAYSFSAAGVYVNLYGSNHLRTRLNNGTPLELEQVTGYPWNGAITLHWKQAPPEDYTLFLRIPGWCRRASLRINGKPYAGTVVPGQYLALKRKWQRGDRVELLLPMPVQLVEANPLVEETRNQVAVQRGPLVYCLESADLPAGERLSHISLPAHIRLQPRPDTIAGSSLVVLEGMALRSDAADWSQQLYRPVSRTPRQPVTVRLIPYYAWANRGHTEMSVWLPVEK